MSARAPHPLRGNPSEAPAALGVTAADARALAATASLRERLLGLEESPLDKDTLLLASMVGRVLAQAGASPTLAATLLDPVVARWPAAGPLRAALFESYTAARTEHAAREATAAWRYPNCVVPLDDGAFAVCASVPTDDPEELADWADGVAAGLARAGARHVVLAGATEAARTALRDALELVGVSAGPRRLHLRLPWGR